MGVARGIGPLDMHDGDIRFERADRQQARSAEWVIDRPNSRMTADDIAPHPGQRRQVGETHRGRLERQANGEVRMVFHDDPPRLPLFVGAAKPVTRSTRDVAHPGGDHLGHCAGGDQLVERHVRDRPDQRQVLAALADDLVHSGEGDAGLERQAERDGIAVVHLFGDRLLQRAAFTGHRASGS